MILFASLKERCVCRGSVRCSGDGIPRIFCVGVWLYGWEEGKEIMEAVGEWCGGERAAEVEVDCVCERWGVWGVWEEEECRPGRRRMCRVCDTTALWCPSAGMRVG